MGREGCHVGPALKDRAYGAARDLEYLENSWAVCGFHFSSSNVGLELEGTR